MVWFRNLKVLYIRKDVTNKINALRGLHVWEQGTWGATQGFHITTSSCYRPMRIWIRGKWAKARSRSAIIQITHVRLRILSLLRHLGIPTKWFQGYSRTWGKKMLRKNLLKIGEHVGLPIYYAILKCCWSAIPSGCPSMIFSESMILLGLQTWTLRCNSMIS